MVTTERLYVNLSDQHVPDRFAAVLALEQVHGQRSSSRWGDTLVHSHNSILVQG